MKIGAMSHQRRLVLTVALCGVLFGAGAGMAQTSCVCSPTCTDCVLCQPEYETVGACDACYKASPVANSTLLLCTFSGTMARAPVQSPASSRPMRPRVDSPLFPRPLPGTRPDAARIAPIAWPDSFVVKKRSPGLYDLRSDTSPTWAESVIAGTLPGTRPDSLRPLGSATLWGTRPDSLQPSLAATAQPPSVWWVLPGTRPDQIRPTFDYLETVRRLEAGSGLSDTWAAEIKQSGGNVGYERTTGAMPPR